MLVFSIHRTTNERSHMGVGTQSRHRRLQSIARRDHSEETERYQGVHPGKSIHKCEIRQRKYKS